MLESDAAKRLSELRFPSTFGRGLNFNLSGAKVRNSGEGKKMAFTLAEVLITLGIIGVVAAMTMPVLVAKYQNLVLSTQLKKVVNNIDNGVKTVLANEGVDSLKDSSLVIPYYATYMLNLERFVSYFKFEPLYDSKLEKDLNNLEIFSGPFGEGKFYRASDGSFWYILSMWISGDGGYEMEIFDINGDKGPNLFGYDRFYLPSMIASPNCDTIMNCYCKEVDKAFASMGVDLKELIMSFDGEERQGLWMNYALCLRYYDGWNINY